MVELSVPSSRKKATEAVLFSDTPELSWTTGCVQGAMGAWDLLGPQSQLPGSPEQLQGCIPLSPSVSTGTLKGHLPGGLLPPTRGLRAPGALPWSLTNQEAAQQLDRQVLNWPLLQEGWSHLGGQGHGVSSNMPASRLCGSYVPVFVPGPY